MTWLLKEMLEGDGLEDLLASSQWCAAVVDPQAVEVRGVATLRAFEVERVVCYACSDSASGVF